MSDSLLLKAGRFRLRSCDHFTFLSVVSGWIAGTYLCAWFHGLSSLLGMSLPVHTGIATAVALALVAGTSLRTLGRSPRIGPWTCFALTHFALATLNVAFPWLLERVAQCAAWGGDAWLGSRSAISAFSFAAGGALIGLPAFWIVRLPRQILACRDRAESSPTETRQAVSHIEIWFLFAVSFGILMDGMLLAPLGGVQLMSALAALAGGLLFVAAIVQTSRPRADAALEPDDFELPVHVLWAPRPANARRTGWRAMQKNL